MKALVGQLRERTEQIQRGKSGLIYICAFLRCHQHGCVLTLGGFRKDKEHEAVTLETVHWLECRGFMCSCPSLPSVSMGNSSKTPLQVLTQVLDCLWKSGIATLRLGTSCCTQMLLITPDTRRRGLSTCFAVVGE